jgi:ankyrin repeat protein
VDKLGFLPILYACKEGHHDVVQFLLSSGSDSTSYLTGHSPIERAAASNSIRIIEVLLQYGASVEDAGVGGRPPVVSAASAGHIEALSQLLDLGADPNATDLLGNTALHSCVANLKDPSHVISLLLFRGADKHLRNLAGETPVTLSLRTLNMMAIEAIGARTEKIS